MTVDVCVMVVGLWWPERAREPMTTLGQNSVVHAAYRVKYSLWCQCPDIRRPTTNASHPKAVQLIEIKWFICPAETQSNVGTQLAHSQFLDTGSMPRSGCVTPG